MYNRLSIVFISQNTFPKSKDLIYEIACWAIQFSVANHFRCPYGKKSFLGIRNRRLKNLHKKIKLYQCTSFCFLGINCSFYCVCLKGNLQRKARNFTKCKCNLLQF